MRNRSVVCLCMMLVAVLTLTGCGRTGGNPSDTPVPKLVTSAPTLPTQPAQGNDQSTDDALTKAKAQADSLFGDTKEGASTSGDDADTSNDDTSMGDDASMGDDLSMGDGTSTMPAAIQDKSNPIESDELPEETDPPESTAFVPRVTPDPSDKPLALDPFDKPTQVPLNIAPITYSNTAMGVSFDRPAGWAEEAPANSNVLFREPQTAMRNGYPAVLTVRMIQKGGKQTKSEANAQLTELLEELAKMPEWSASFKASKSEPAYMDNAEGYYAYYNATYNNIELRGRIMVVARGNALYMVRITSSKEFYLLYEAIYRQVRTTWKFF